jgi:hypothetical protein
METFSVDVSLGRFVVFENVQGDAKSRAYRNLDVQIGAFCGFRFLAVLHRTLPEGLPLAKDK